MVPTCIRFTILYANVIGSIAYVNKVPLGGIGKVQNLAFANNNNNNNGLVGGNMMRRVSHHDMLKNNYLESTLETRQNIPLLSFSCRNNNAHGGMTSKRLLNVVRFASNNDDNNQKEGGSSSSSSSIQKIQKKVKDLDLNAIKENVKNFLQRNIFNVPKDKEFGSSGEISIIMEIALLFCIFRGHIPLLQQLISFLFGPVLFLLGIAVMSLGIKELNTSSFTALTNPIPAEKGGKMVTSGVYSYIRHPVYAGNLCCFIGLSVMTNSSIRLLLTSLYYVVVELKSRQEEMNMEKEFGFATYRKYKEIVKGKFIPSRDRIVQEFQDQKGSGNKSKNGDDTTDDMKGLLFP